MKKHAAFIFIIFGAVITLRSQLTVAENRQADLPAPVFASTQVAQAQVRKQERGQSDGC